MFRVFLRAFLAIVLGLGMISNRCEAGQPAEGGDSWLSNGVTAHRGNSGEWPENTIPAFESAIELGVDWIEFDIFRTRDGRLVVIHDETTARVGDRSLDVKDSTFEELRTVDVATEFRRLQRKSLSECPPQHIPLLEDVLRLVVSQQKTRVSIQPKMDCVAEAVELVQRMKAAQHVGFNDGSLPLMAKVKELAPAIPVFWDRGTDASLEHDLAVAKKHDFESLVLHRDSVTKEKVQQIVAAGLEAGAWTVNDPATMERMLDMGIERIYTDHPRNLLALLERRSLREAFCEGTYPHHLQGICADDESIYWSFTTTLVKTDLRGQVLLKVPVDNHHGDLCFHDGKLYVAVNRGKFNDPAGNAKSSVCVYDALTLKEFAEHDTPEVFHGAGGIGVHNGHFFVVGGLPEGVPENFVYEYDAAFSFVKKHTIASGHTLMGIQTATFAGDRWWFGCYGDPKILLVTDADFRQLGRYEFDCSLGIAGWSEGKLLAASGRCSKPGGCTGEIRVVVPDETAGLRIEEDGSTDGE